MELLNHPRWRFINSNVIDHVGNLPFSMETIASFYCQDFCSDIVHLRLRPQCREFKDEKEDCVHWDWGQEEYEIQMKL